MIPIIVASDKTHLTNFGGNKSAWPIYMSLGNINSKIRNSPSKKAWVTIAYMPIPQFLDDSNVRGALADRLFHQCCDIVFVSLMDPTSIEIPDSLGDVRLASPVLLRTSRTTQNRFLSMLRQGTTLQ